MKLVYKIDFAIILISIFSLIFIIGYISPMIISPINNLKTSEKEILFSIENADYLLVDDNLDFTTPDTYPLEEGLKINLAPGKYYWKAVGILKSETRTLTVNSEVNLQLKKLDEKNYGVFNAGNIRLNVEVYNGTSLIEKRKLPVDKTMNLTGTKIIGRQE
jgi:hypothetical protein